MSKKFIRLCNGCKKEFQVVFNEDGAVDKNYCPHCGKEQPMYLRIAKKDELVPLAITDVNKMIIIKGSVVIPGFKPVILRSEEELPEKVLDIWKNPKNYYKNLGDRDRYRYFLYLLWIIYPDNKEVQLKKYVKSVNN